MIEIIFLGRGGQGAFTSSRILGIATSLYEKKHGLSFPSFGPERRGAPVFAFTKISEIPIRDRTQSSKADYFVVLDESLYHEGLLNRLKVEGKLIINTSCTDKYQDSRIIPFDASPIANKYLGKNIVNTAMLAVLVSYSQIVRISSLQKAIEYDLPGQVADKNEKLIAHIEACFKEDRYKEERYKEEKYSQEIYRNRRENKDEGKLVQISVGGNDYE